MRAGWRNSQPRRQGAGWRRLWRTLVVAIAVGGGAEVAMARSFDFTENDNAYASELAVDAAATASTVIAGGQGDSGRTGLLPPTSSPVGNSFGDEDFGAIQREGSEGRFPVVPDGTLYIAAAELDGSDITKATIGATEHSTRARSVRTAEAAVVVSVVADSESVDEADGAASFTVRLSKSPAAAVAVNWDIDADATTTHPDGYTRPSDRTLTFAAGTTELSQQFTIGLVDDTVVEPTTVLAVRIELSNPPAGTVLGNASSAAVTVTDQDTATVSLVRAAGTGATAHEGETVRLEARLSGPVAVPVVARWRLRGGVDDEDVDGPESGTVTFAASRTAGASTQPLDFTITDDDLDEGLELLDARLAVEMVQSDGAAARATARRGARAVTDTAAPGIANRIAVRNGRVLVPIHSSDIRITFKDIAVRFWATEGAGEAKIPLVFSRGPDVPATVTITAAPSGNAEAADFELNTPTVAIDTYQAEAAVGVTAVADGVWDGASAESVTLTIASVTPAGAFTVGSYNSVTVDLIDAEYDTSKTVVRLVASRTKVSENDSNEDLTLQISAVIEGANLSRNTRFELTPVDRSNVENTAQLGNTIKHNYEITSDMTLITTAEGDIDVDASIDGEIEITDNERSDVFRRDDDVVVYNATIILTAVPVAGAPAEEIVVVPVRIDIKDNDPVYLHLERYPTPGNWLKIDGEDELDEGQRRHYSILFEPPPVVDVDIHTIEFQPLTGATLDDFGVWGPNLVRKEGRSNRLSFSATLEAGRSTLTFFVGATADGVWEPNDRGRSRDPGRVFVRFNARGSPPGGDIVYQRKQSFYLYSVDQTPPPALRVVVEPATVLETVLDNERDGKVTVSVMVDGGEQGVTIGESFEVVYDFQGNPDDYTVANAVGSAGAGVRVGAPVTLSIVDDDLAEGTESVTIGLDKTAPGFSSFLTGTNIVVHPATLTILDDDSATPTVFVQPSELQFDENGSAILTVKLSATVASAVTVEFTVNTETATDSEETELESSEYTLPSPASVTFAANASGDNLEQAFTITLPDDEVIELPETMVVDVALATGTDSSVMLGTDSVSFVVTSADTATVGVTGSGTVNEDGGSGVAEFTVTLTGQTTHPVMVDWAAGGMAGNTDDVSAVTGTLMFPAATSSTPQSQMVRIDINDDTRTEGEEPLILEIASITSNLGELVVVDQNADTATINVAASDTVVVSMPATPFSATEGGSVVELPVSLSVSSGFDIVVPLVVGYLDGASQADWRTIDELDFTIPAGQTTARFRMVAVDDTVWENDFIEQLTFSLGTLPPGVSAGTTTMTTVTLVDNDPEPPFEVSVHAVRERVREIGMSPAATFEVRLTRQNRTTTDLIVNWSVDTANTTATASADYNATPASFTFAGGSTNVIETIRVPLVNDEIVELDETLAVQISISNGGAGHGFTLGTASRASVTVEDTDVAEVSIVAPVGTSTITEGDSVEFTIALSKAVIVDVPVVWTIGGDVVDEDVDQATTGTVTFMANADQAGRTHTLTLTATEEMVSELAESLEVSVAVGDTLDARFAAESDVRIRTRGNQTTATVTIQASDIGINFGAATLTATETLDAATVRVILAQAPGVEVTIPIVVSYGGGAVAEDFTISLAESRTLTIAADQIGASFTVHAVGDGVYDGPMTESVTFAFGTLAPAGVLRPGTIDTVTVEAIDAEFDPEADDIVVRVTTPRLLYNEREEPNVGTDHVVFVGVSIDVPPGGLRIPRTFTLFRDYDHDETTEIESGAFRQTFFAVRSSEIQVDAEGNVVSRARLLVIDNDRPYSTGYRKQKLVVDLEPMDGFTTVPVVLTLQDNDSYDARFSNGSATIEEGDHGDYTFWFGVGALDQGETLGFELGRASEASSRVGFTDKDLSIEGRKNRSDGAASIVTQDPDDLYVYEFTVNASYSPVFFRVLAKTDNLWEVGSGRRVRGAPASEPTRDYVKIYLKNGGFREDGPPLRGHASATRELDISITDTTPAPTVAVLVDRSTVSEADNNRIITVTLTVDGGGGENNIQIDGDRRVTFTVEGTGVTSDDYILSSNQAAFTSRAAASEPVTLAVNNDLDDEGEETFVISAQLSEVEDTRINLSADQLTIASANVVVADDDVGKQGVVMAAVPSTVIEGSGVVDVVVTATVDTAISGTPLTMALAQGTGSAVVTEDFVVVGHVTNPGRTNEAAASGLPSVVVAAGDTVGRATLQLRIPTGADGEPAEQIVLTSTPNDPGFTADEVIIAIPTTQPAEGEDRRTRKVVELADNAGDLEWNRATGTGSMSSSSFVIGSTTYTLHSIIAESDENRLSLVVSQELPDSHRWRFVSGRTTTDLFVDAATESVAVSSPTSGWRYRWDTDEDSSLTLPTLTADTPFTLSLSRIDEAPAFAGGVTVADQTWHRGTAVEQAMPAATGGNPPVTYTTDPVLPDGLAIYGAGDAVPGTVTCTAARPAICGTPTIEFATNASMMWVATDEDDDADNLTFSFEVTTAPPTGFTVTPQPLAMDLAWTAPTTPTGAGVAISGYRIEVSTDGGASWSDLVPDTGSLTTTYSHSGFTSADIGAVRAYRVSALSNAGTSLASNVDSGVVIGSLTDLPTVVTLPSGLVGPMFQVVVTFSEKVTGFDTAADITVSSNASAGDPVSVTTPPADVNRIFNVPITATDEQPITISIGSGVANAAVGGRVNTASLPRTITADVTRPTPTITRTPAGRPVNANFQITIDFGEVVSGFELGDIVLNGQSAGASVSNLQPATASQEYTADVTLPTADGTLTITVPADRVQDAVRLVNVAATPMDVVIDRAAPEVSFTFAGSPTPTAPLNTDFTVGIRFTEPVTGFDANDVSVSHGTRGALTTVTADVEYTLAVTAPAGSADVRISIGAGAVQDHATNPNVANSHTVVVDKDPPSYRIDPRENSRIRDTFTVTIDFGEPVFGFDASSVSTRSEMDINRNSFSAVAGFPGRFTFELNVRSRRLGNNSRILDGDRTSITVDRVDVADAVGNIDLPNTRTGYIPTDLVWYTIDLSPPVPQISLTPASKVHANADFTVNFNFGEPVGETFTVDDILVTPSGAGGAGVTNFQHVRGRQRYSATITVPDEDGLVTITVPPGSVVDYVDRSQTEAGSLTVTIDRVVPVVTFPGAPTAVNGSFDLIILFTDGPVTAFTAGDITLEGIDGATVTNLTADVAGEQYTASIDLPDPEPSEPSGGEPGDPAGGDPGDPPGDEPMDPPSEPEVVLTVSVAADTVMDAAGNTNVLATHEIRLDRVSPTITSIASDATGDITGTDTLTITFDEKVFGLETSDIAFSGSGAVGTSLTETSTGDAASVFTLSITPTADGTLTVSIGAGAVTDAAGNDNVEFTQDFMVMLANPTVVITDPVDGALLNTDTFSLTIRFSEEVTVQSGATLTVTNGTVGTLSPSSAAQEFTVTFTPTADGAVTVAVPADFARATAAPGAGNLLSETYTFHVDRMAPVASFPDAPTLVNSSFDITIAFASGGPVTEFLAEDITLVGGTGAEVAYVVTETEGERYTARINLPNEPEVTLTVRLATGAVMDAAGNPNALLEHEVEVDTVAPVVESIDDGIEGDIPGVFTLTITFDDKISGLTEDEVVFGGRGATGSNLVQTSVGDANSVFTIDVVPSGNGTLTVTIPAGAVTDDAGNGNPAYEQEFTVALVLPTASITMPENGTRFNTATLDITISFSTEMTLQPGESLTITNGTAGTFSPSGAAREFTTAITPAEEGRVRITVPVNFAQSTGALTLGNEESDRYTFHYDLTAPGVEITAAQDLVNGPFLVTVTFAESVTGFTLAELLIGNGTNDGTLTGTEPTDVYTTMVTPTAHGDVTLNISASAAMDLATNPNTAATELVVTADLVAPTVTGITSAEAATVTGPFDITVTFSEPVNGFTASDLVLTNASAGTVTPAADRRSFTVNIQPGEEGTVSVQVGDDAVRDDAGNRSPAPTTPPLTRAVDLPGTDPIITRTPAGRPVNANFQINIDFGSVVSGFELDDIEVTGENDGADVINLQPTTPSARYTAEVVVPTVDREISIHIPAGRVRDASNGTNTASPTITVEVDITRPGVRFIYLASPTPQTPQRTDFTVGIRFREPVSSLSVDSILLSAGTKGAFVTKIEGRHYELDVIATDIQGDLKVTVIAGAVQDDATNTNEATSHTVVVDTRAPAPRFEPVPGSMVSDEFTLTIDFDEQINGFSSNDISSNDARLVNSSFSAVTGDPGRYTILAQVSNIVADEDPISISVRSNAGTDLIGNASVAGTATYILDRTPEGVGESGKTAVTVTASPSSIIEGSGLVDIVFTASVPSAVTDTRLTIDLAQGKGTALPGTDFVVAGHVVNPNSTFERLETGFPSITINVGQTEATTPAVLQLRALAGDAVEPAEEIAIVATPDDRTNYAVSSLTISIPTTRLATSETRYLQKQVRLEDISTNNDWLDWRPGRSVSRISSTLFTIGGTSYALTRVFSQPSEDRFTVTYTPDAELATGFTWRLVAGSTTYDLPVGDASNSQSAGGGWRYRWDTQDGSSSTLPTLAANVPFDLILLKTDDMAAFAEGATIPAQTWHRDTAGGMEMPTAVAGNDPITYTVTPALPADLVVVGVGGTPPSGVTCGNLPAICGTPTTEFATNATMMWTARDADGQTASLPFSLEVTTLPPTGLTVTPESLAMALAWTAPTPTTAGVEVSGYRIEVSTDAGASWQRVSGNTGDDTVAYTDSGLTRADIDTTRTYRVSAISNAGTSLPSDTASGVVIGPPPDLTPTITSPRTGATVAGTFEVRVEFSEPVTGFDAASDITVTSNATAMAPVSVMEPAADVNRVFTVSVTAMNDLQITISIEADVANAVNGNRPNIASSPVTVTADRILPTVQFPSDAPTHVNANFTLRITFSESIGTTFADDGSEVEFQHTGTGAASATVTAVTAGTAYDVTVTPPADEGTLTITIPANAVQDDAGNNNLAASHTVIVDRTPPVPTFGPTETVDGDFQVSIQFEEDVSGLEGSDISVSAGSLVASSLMEPVANRQFTVDVTAPDESGDVVVTLAAGAVMDTAGNPSAQHTHIVTVARAVPVTVTFAEDAPTHVREDFTLRITFGEDIGATFAADGSEVGLEHTGTGTASATVAEVTAGTVYDLTIMLPADDGTLTITIPDGAVQNNDSVDNAAATHTVVVDRVAPMPSFVSPTPTVPVGGDFQVSIEFDEDVSGLEETEITVSEGSLVANSLTETVANRQFTVGVTAPNESAEVVVTLTAGAVMDAAGNTNLVHTHTVTVDRTLPSVMFPSDAPTHVRENFTLRITFGENIGSTFDTDNSEVEFLHTGTGTASATVTEVTAGTVYDVMVTLPADDGTLTITVPANSVQDGVGNNNEETSHMVTVDRAPPIPTFVPPTPTGPVGGDFEVSIEFDEEVRGLDQAAITVSAGSLVPNSLTTTVANRQYTVSVRAPTESTSVVVTLTAGAAMDLAGNTSPEATHTVTVTRVGPAVMFPSDAPTHVREDFTLRITFSQDIGNTFAADGSEVELDYTGTSTVTATVTAVTAGTVYDVMITLPTDPMDDGTLTIAIPEGAVQNGDSIDNAAATHTVVVDRSRPTPTFVSPTPTGPVGGDFQVSIQFEEDVSGLEESEITVDAGTVVPNSLTTTVANRQFTVDVMAPSSSGDVMVTIVDGAVTDLAGNTSTALTHTVTVDRSTPEVMFAEDAPTHVRADFTLRITFSQDIGTSFAADGSEVEFQHTGTGTAVAAVTAVTAGTVYDVAVTLPNDDGTLTITIPANAVQNARGLDNAAASHMVRVDRTPPTFTFINPTPTSPQNDDFKVRIGFVEDVTGMAEEDFSASGGSITPGSFVETLANRQFTVDVAAPATDGVVVITVADGAAMDLAGNVSAMDTHTVQVDKTVPEPELSPATGTRLGSGASGDGEFDFTLTVDFGETVTGFEESDITVGTGATLVASSLNPVVTDPGRYTATLRVPSATGDGATITVTINANAATDTASNRSTMTSATYIVDRAPPVVDLSAAPAHVNGDFTFTITISNGPVAATEFTQSDISLTGIADATLTLTEDVAGMAYTAAVTIPSATDEPALDADLIISVAADQVRDTAGQANAAATATVRADHVAPTVASMTRAGTGDIAGIFTLTVTFSEKVNGFTRDDLTIEHGSAAEPAETSTGNAPSVFTVEITPTGDSPLTVDVAADRVTDLAGNGNTAATQFSAPVMLVVPIANIVAAAGVGNEVAGVTYINTDTFNVSISFTQAVSGFDAAADVAVTNGTAGAPADDGAGDVYTVTITPTAGFDGVVTVRVPANAATATAEPMAGNPISSIVSFTVDRTDPTIAEIVVPDPARANAAFPVTIRFSEPVTGFAIADLAVEGGSAGTLTATDATLVGTTDPTAMYNAVFTTMVTPTATGNVTLNIAADVAQDRATNDNAVATERTVTADLTAPTVANITSAAPATVRGAFNITVTFSEPVNDFTHDDLEVDNGAADESIASADRVRFTVTITPTADGPISVQVKAESVVDDFGNRGPAALAPATPFSRTVALPEAPGKPTDLRAFKGRNTINLQWRAPANDGGAAITGYRIEASPTGRDPWANVVVDTMSPATTYGHGELQDSVTLHYRVYARNAAGESTVSDPTSASTLPAFMVRAEDREMVDINDDGRITGMDASALYFQVIGVEEDPRVRRTLIEPLLPTTVDRNNADAVNEAIDQVLEAIEDTLESNGDALDVNGDGDTDELDAQIILNVTEFPDLVGDGTPRSGFLTYRRVLIGRFMSGGAPSDAEMRAVIRLIRGI